MTPQEERAKVEAAWERVECHASYNGRYSTHIAIKVPDRRSKLKDFYTLAYWWGNDFVEEKSWAVIIHPAYLFTKEHKKKIADVKEEIDSTTSDIRWFAQGGQIEDRQQEAIHRRILAREQAVLADLLRGWRGGE